MKQFLNILLTLICWHFSQDFCFDIYMWTHLLCTIYSIFYTSFKQHVIQIWYLTHSQYYIRCFLFFHGTISPIFDSHFVSWSSFLSKRDGTWLDDVVQQHSEVSLGQRAPKGHSSIGSYNHKTLRYQWVTTVKWGFTGYAKQADSKCLKFCLCGLF